MISESTIKTTDTSTAFAPADKHIWGIYIFLCIISIIELYSASSREVAASAIGVYGPIVRHGIMLFAGFCIILVLQHIHYAKFYKLIPILTLVSILMMLYVIFCGDVVNGARRSFKLLGFTMQPSEFLKLSAAAMIAQVMSKAQIKGGVSSVGVWIAATIILLFGAMLIPQGLTNTALLMFISLSMMLVGGVSWSKFLKVICVYIVLFTIYIGVSYTLSSHNSGYTPDHQNTEQIYNDPTSNDKGVSAAPRLSTWISRITQFRGEGKPKYEEKIDKDNRQEMYGYMAQAHGGVVGVMPGNSRETSRLPLAFSDFIYSIIVEEFGLVGGLVVLVLYLWLLMRASAIASHCTRAFPTLLVIGMALVIVYQALFHICIVTGVMPVSGQPLPLISKGGTSIIVTSIAFGVMLSISRFATRTGSKKKDCRTEIEALPAELRAENPTQLQ